MTNYKPSDIFIGVFEFFGILLPGAALMFLLQDTIGHLFDKVFPPLNNDLQRWIAYLSASYIAGHFLHALGFLLDRFLYDDLYKPLRLAKSKGSNFLLNRAKQIIVSSYGISSEDLDHLNAFVWAGSVVRSLSPAASQELDRGGAESKFFRSLTYVFFVGLILSIYQSGPCALVCFVLALFSLWRFMDLRWKNIQLTYEYFLILNRPDQVTPKPMEGSQLRAFGINLGRSHRQNP
jgi:hypothetical protein